MAAGTSDPFDGIRWLFAHPQSIIWFIAVVAVWFRWMSRRVRAAPSTDAPDGRRALLDGLRLAAAAAKSAQAAAQTRRFAGSAAPATLPRAPVPAPLAGPISPRAVPVAISGAGAAWPQGGPTAGDATRGLGQPARAPRSPLLEAFRSPGGARGAVILAEILAPPVGLR